MSTVLTSPTKHRHRAAQVLPKRVDTQSLHDASTKSEERARKYANEASMRKNVYKAKVTATTNLRKTGDTLSAGQKRLIDKMLLGGKCAGLAPEKKDKERLKRSKDDLSDPCLKFMVCPFLCGSHRWLLKHACSRSKTLTRRA